MVNENKNIKEDIIKQLYLAKGKIVSGIKLSEIFKISRTAIWKHITSLKKSGYDIESRSKGYVLLNHDDLLLPFCFNKKFQNRIFHFQELETTMDKAKILAKDSAPHLSIVIAENQTLSVGDDIMYLVIAGDIRENVQTALRDALDKIKTTATKKKQSYI